MPDDSESEDSSEIDVSYENNTCTMSVSGTLDLNTADALYEHYERSKEFDYGALVIDFEGMHENHYIDSAGVANLIKILKDTGNRGVPLTLKKPNKIIMDNLELSRTGNLFDIRD